MNSMLTSLLAQPQVEPIRVSRIILNFGTREVAIEEDEFVIGRAEFCDLVIPDLAVADFAARIRLDGGAAWIEATEFSSVVMIDGRPYRRRALRDGDRLQFGGQVCSVTLQTNREPATQVENAAVSRELLEQEIRELFELMNWKTIGETSSTQRLEDSPRSLPPQGVQALLRAALSSQRGQEADSGELPIETHLAAGIDEVRHSESDLHDLRVDLDERTRAAQRELEARIESLLNHLGESAAALRASA
ncbi:hypothetical protein Spb1_37010 [Planctopirus ephydatiae]|uniref:FHA domain-containing protein n=1 Tax=Planctopirus ephydatiae TaxID=2528019 RepID=A0A518GT47_9PLAN|nr:FHA domain-containing protein [Planctopirus ephydatiae]QDV31756.1 hypothetical protein Spb1_37010 [Planctopirus ephydatiae]